MNGSPEGWECAPECPIRLMNEQSGILKSGARKGANPNATRALADAYDGGWKYTGGACEASEGGASRYFPNFSSEESEQPLPESPVESTILVGDCREVLAEMEAESVDALVCDPPAGINFMNKAFDSDRGGRDQWIAWLRDIMKEAYRVMKPGAHGLVWALPRTSHWTAMALEDAGFEIRDRVTHHFGSGFPKSLDVSKQLDKMAGVEREVVGHRDRYHDGKKRQDLGPVSNLYEHGLEGRNGYDLVTAPATEEAKRWQGFGTALKPSTEDWWLIRRPLSEKNVASQVLKTGTGAINIDATRVQTSENLNGGAYSDNREKSTNKVYGEYNRLTPNDYEQPKGRWSPNLLLSHHELCRPTGEIRRVKGSNGVRGRGSEIYANGKGFANTLSEVGQEVGYADPDGYEGVEEVLCVEGCPVEALSLQSNGGDRFFPRFPSSLEPEAPFKYAAKASRREREAGLQGVEPQEVQTGCGGDMPIDDNGKERDRFKKVAANTHPTVKPLMLMKWLCRLVCPPGGTILDPFCGSGSTGCAAVQEGFNFIGIEQSEEYAEIARRRIAHWSNIPDSLEKSAAPSQTPKTTLF